MNKSEKTIYLHIGLEKTGSTSIQNFLYSNKGQLKDIGILYPDCWPSPAGHLGLALISLGSYKQSADLCSIFSICKSEDDYNKVIDQFNQNLQVEIDKSNCSSIVFSSEHCSSRLIDVEQITKLKEYLQSFKFEIKVLIYLRRQDQFLMSSYSTAVKSGDTNEFSIPDFSDSTSRYDYLNLIEKWATVFGNESIIVRRFGREYFFNNSLLQDFCEQVQIPLVSALQWDKAHQPVNKQLDRTCLNFLTKLNKYVKPTNKTNVQYREKLIQILETISNGLTDYYDFSAHSRLAFVERYRESNQYIAKKYFNADQLFSIDDLTDLKISSLSYDLPESEQILLIADRIFCELTGLKSIKVDLSEIDKPSIKFRGFLEIYNRHSLAGWVMASDPEFIPILDVYVNDEYVSSFRPEIPRPSLGPGKIGFRYNFRPDFYSDFEQFAKIDVRVRLTDESIGNSPIYCSVDVNDPKKVLKGKDNVLFLLDDFIQTDSKLSTKGNFSVDAEKSWKNIFLDRLNHIKNRKIIFSQLIVPLKARVYRDKLPEKNNNFQDCTFEQWERVFKETLGKKDQYSICYPLDSLLEYRKYMDTYSKGDTHWNFYGSYIAYSDLIDKLNEKNDLKLNKLKVDSSAFEVAFKNADILSKLGGGCLEDQIVINEKMLTTKIVKNNDKSLDGRQILYKSTLENPDPYKLLFFHDSYGLFIEQYLASSFSEVMCIWSPDVLWDTVDSFKPDFIVMEQVERFLIRAPKS